MWLKVHLRTHRGSQRHSGRWGKLNNCVRDGSPRGPSAPQARGTPSTSHQMKGSPEHPVTVGGYERPGECGTHYEMLGRALWNCTRLIIGMVKGGTNGGQSERWRWFREERARKQRDKRINGARRRLGQGGGRSGGDGLYQQLEWGSSLRSSYIQLPATGKPGIQGQLLDRLRVWA